MKRQEELLDIKQAAQFLQVSETSLRRWTASGRLACLRIGRKRERRFRRTDLVAFMEDQPGLVTRSGALPDPAAGVQIPNATHLFSIYSSDNGRATQALRFLSEGLAAGDTCFLIANRDAQEQILSRSGLGEPPLREAADAGNLVVLETAATGMKQFEDWESEFLAAMSRGAKSLRVVIDLPSDLLRDGHPVSTVLEFERAYDRRFAKRFPLVTLCQYAAEYLSGSGLMEVCRNHPDAFAYPVDRLID